MVANLARDTVQKVGTALLETVFQVSNLLGFGGYFELIATSDSYGFYKKTNFSLEKPRLALHLSPFHPDCYAWLKNQLKLQPGNELKMFKSIGIEIENASKEGYIQNNLNELRKLCKSPLFGNFLNKLIEYTPPLLSAESYDKVCILFEKLTETPTESIDAALLEELFLQLSADKDSLISSVAVPDDYNFQSLSMFLGPKAVLAYEKRYGLMEPIGSAGYTSDLDKGPIP